MVCSIKTSFIFLFDEWAQNDPVWGRLLKCVGNLSRQAIKIVQLIIWGCVRPEGDTSAPRGLKPVSKYNGIIIDECMTLRAFPPRNCL